MIDVVRTFLAIAALGLGAPALAGPVLLSPLYADSSVNTKQRALVNDTLANELDLQPGFDGVTRLQRRPSTLTTSCLGKAKCLSRIAESNGTNALVAGKARRRGRLFWLDLTFFEGGRIVRQGTYSVPTDPTGLANAMGPVVRELVTGLTKDDDGSPPIADVDFDDLADFEDEPLPEAPAPAPRDQPEISFGTPDVSTAPLDEEDERVPDVDPRLEPVDSRPPPSPIEEDRDAQRELRRRQREREKEQAKAARLAARPEPEPGGATHSVQVIGRLGGSKYYAYNFLTVGGEVAVRATDGLHFMVGVGAYNVNLELTPAEQVEFGRLRYWDQIFPVHFGFLYKFRGNEDVRPYAGLEIILAQYFVDDVGADWAGGPRLRGGVDWMLHENFGVNADLALGGWLGQNWEFIDPRLRPVGLLPQLTVGPLVSF
ncbi:MAG: hypothetical protein AAF211_26170 [Myxococcota bacterium]